MRSGQTGCFRDYIEFGSGRRNGLRELHFRTACFAANEGDGGFSSIEDAHSWVSIEYSISTP